MIIMELYQVIVLISEGILEFYNFEERKLI
jgi:hypothetical protein